MTQYINSAVTIMKKCENYELKRIDAEIAELEARISLKQEQRREIINRKDLNKNEGSNRSSNHCIFFAG